MREVRKGGGSGAGFWIEGGKKCSEGGEGVVGLGSPYGVWTPEAGGEGGGGNDIVRHFDMLL